FVFTGCCWAGLIVDSPEPGEFVPRTPDKSIALTMLDNGAVAFIGATGVHYSPVAAGDNADPEAAASAHDDYLCKALHAAFWQGCARGLAPAQALLEAKLDYLWGIPYAGAQLAPDVQTALELKNCFEMTCLGMGW